MKGRILISSLILVALVLGAYAQATPEPTAVPTEKPMMEPTAVPEPIATLEPQDIVDIAVADGRFQTLVAAIQASELVEALKGEGPFTVFAPTDDAFAALPEGTVDALLADIPALTDILLYYVLEGKVIAADVAGLSQAMFQAQDVGYFRSSTIHQTSHPCYGVFVIFILCACHLQYTNI